MSEAHKRTMLPEEFLAWEARQEQKWEFDGFRPVAMVSSSDAHAAIQGNTITSLNNRLRATPCRVRGPETKVQTGQSYRYPDALVSCTPVAPRSMVAIGPIVIFDVLSDSTAETDRTDKLREYTALPSVQHYVMLEQNRAYVTVITRMVTGWVLEVLDQTGTISLPQIEISIPVSEIYEGLAFPSDT